MLFINLLIILASVSSIRNVALRSQLSKHKSFCNKGYLYKPSSAIILKQYTSENLGTTCSNSAWFMKSLSRIVSMFIVLSPILYTPYNNNAWALNMGTLFEKESLLQDEDVDKFDFIDFMNKIVDSEDNSTTFYYHNLCWLSA